MDMFEKTVALIFATQDNNGIPFVVTNNIAQIAEFWNVKWKDRSAQDVVKDIWIKFDLSTQEPK